MMICSSRKQLYHMGACDRIFCIALLKYHSPLQYRTSRHVDYHQHLSSDQNHDARSETLCQSRMHSTQVFARGWLPLASTKAGRQLRSMAQVGHDAIAMSLYVEHRCLSRFAGVLIALCCRQVESLLECSRKVERHLKIRPTHVARRTVLAWRSSWRIKTLKYSSPLTRRAQTPVRLKGKANANRQSMMYGLTNISQSQFCHSGKQLKP